MRSLERLLKSHVYRGEIVLIGHGSGEKACGSPKRERKRDGMDVEAERGHV